MVDALKAVSSKERPPRRLGAALKVLAVLEAFAAHYGAISLAELADRTGLPKSTAHRMLCFLQDAEFVESENGLYHLSSKVEMLSAGQPTTLSLTARSRLMPFLAELYELTHEVVQLVVRVGGSGQVIERMHSHRSTHLAVHRGSSQPLHQTATGKVLIADLVSRPEDEEPGASKFWWLEESHRAGLAEELASVRASGIAYEHDDWRSGICGVAAAVRGPRLEVLAAIGVIGPVGRFRHEAVAPYVRKIAQIATRELNASVRLGRADRPVIE